MEKIDRRKRRSNDPTTAITVNIPIALKDRLDELVIETRATRSGMICMAIRNWLTEREEMEDSTNG